MKRSRRDSAKGKNQNPPDFLEALLSLEQESSSNLNIKTLIRQVLDNEQRARLTAETLLRATAALNSSLELKEVLNLILEQLQLVVRFDSASVMLIEEERLRILAVRGHPNPEAALQVAIQPYENLLTRQILEGRELLILADARQDPRFTRLGDAGYVRGWMGIPLATRGEAIGVLTVDSCTPEAYNLDDARLAQAFADQAALAVTNARLYESEREQRALAQALREISLALSSSLKSDVILAALLELVEQVVAYDSARVLLVEDERARAVAHRGYERYGVGSQVVERDLSIDGMPNLRNMAEQLRPGVISDVKASREWVVTDLSRHFGSWLGAPLVAHGRLLGFLSLEKVEPGYYKARHAERLESLAGHVALALLNGLTFGEMERASVTDFLTGSHNHRYFQQELRRELELAHRIGYPVSLLILDLDYFKGVNDVYGHLCGDRVLQLLAGRLKLELRNTDHLARYGGEEFAVILPGSPALAAREVGERLRRAVAETPFLVEDRREAGGESPSLGPLHLTVSIGVAAFPANAAGPRELVAAADRGLYQAKSNGRDCVCLAPG